MNLWASNTRWGMRRDRLLKDHIMRLHIGTILKVPIHISTLRSTINHVRITHPGHLEARSTSRVELCRGVRCDNAAKPLRKV